MRNYSLLPREDLTTVSRFHTDSEPELELIRQHALTAGAFDARVAENWEKGGAGAVELGRAVVEACKEPSQFKVGRIIPTVNY